MTITHTPTRQSVGELLGVAQASINSAMKAVNEGRTHQALMFTGYGRGAIEHAEKLLEAEVNGWPAPDAHHTYKAREA